MSTLTASMGLKLGPILLLTALSHFLDRHKEGASKARDELLFDEAFIVVKAFLEASSKYSVEELQEFANTRIPASPAVRSVRLLVPLSSCNDAAGLLIKALGGPEFATRIAGGIRWWQVRGLQGVDANWVVSKKDIDELRKANKLRRKATINSGTAADGLGRKGAPAGNTAAEREDESTYATEMDNMPCMYYIHGGGYYFGSVDQERYCMQRYARKMKGRVFGVNYRLAPQYPFPCALQDVLAGYLYLIRPPTGVHQPIPPNKIVLYGDSAGGGLVFALLQLIRDTGLPAPAGAVLVSPWTDLTHSFPSVFENTATDVLPPYGLGLHRPSTLWPPPAEEASRLGREKLTQRLRSVVPSATGLRTIPNAPATSQDMPTNTATTEMPSTSKGDSLLPSSVSDTLSPHEAGKKLTPTLSHLSRTRLEVKDDNDSVESYQARQLPDTSAQYIAPQVPASTPAGTLPLHRGEPLRLEVGGKPVEIHSQIQVYAMNHQLGHPLISPAMGYLGGLPPLYIMCSDKEVLRDEAIYVSFIPSQFIRMRNRAHKAAGPDHYPVKKEARELYPPLSGIETRFGPTNVHLQVYDETCHCLPMFSFATPAKFCYRAIAAFCKEVTSKSSVSTPNFSQHDNTDSATSNSSLAPIPTVRTDTLYPHSTELASPRRVSSNLSMNSSTSSVGIPVGSTGMPIPWSRDTSVVIRSPEVSKSMPGVAGHATVYHNIKGTNSPFPETHMIRERVSTSGVLRLLEAPDKLAGCTIAQERLGLVTEVGALRYLDGQALWDKKYSNTAKRVARHREKNVKLAKQYAVKVLNRLQYHLASTEKTKQGEIPGESLEAPAGNGDPADDVRLILNSPLWTWSWALEGENPPPSSIASRADTSEARRLIKSADIRLDEKESKVSGNNLWAVVLNGLSASTDDNGSRIFQTNNTKEDDEEKIPRRRKSFIGRLFTSGNPSLKS